jgi:hypothetical protein
MERLLLSARFPQAARARGARGFELRVCLLALLAVSGCASWKTIPHPIRDFEAHVAEERRYYRHDGPQPKLCLALSGGGLRSAAFSLGVMHGLEDVGVLRQVDVASAVSGGSYALSWFYVQHAAGDATTAQLLGDEGRHQHFLSENFNLRRRLWDWAQVLLNTLTIPLYVTTDYVFDTQLNLNYLRWIYEYRIMSLFHAVPEYNPGQARPFWNRFPRRRLEPSFHDLRATIQSKGLPFFVLNTNAVIDDDYMKSGADLANANFEITPLGYGSDYYGYIPIRRRRDGSDDAPLDLGGAVSISGAAVDVPILASARQKALFDITALSLGFHIDNYHAKDPLWMEWFRRAAPFPFHLFWKPARDRDGLTIQLTDGGHAENLGLFALVRRQCSRIISVDAEHDPRFELSGYRKAKKKLRQELLLDLRVTSGEGVDLEEWVQDMRGDAASEPLSHRWPEPVLRGSIAPLGTGDPIELVYVKLALDPSVIGDDEIIRDYMAASGAGDDSYPQQPTSDLIFDKAQFLAYKRLGYRHVVDYSWSDFVE